MKLETALAVAKQKVKQKSTLVMYRARNGQYMTDRPGSPCLLGRQVWTMEEFVKEFGK